MRKRILILPIGAAIIAALCAYKLTRTYDAPARTADLTGKRRAPGFALFDHHKPPQPVRLEGYLGRHEILLVFFDGEVGFDRDPVVRRLLAQTDELRSSGLIVLAISTALPQHNRQVIGRLVEAGVLKPGAPLPFRVLSDVDYRVHEDWGRWDVERQRTRPAAFFVDRAGNVAWSGIAPEPVADIDRLLDERLGEALAGTAHLSATDDEAAR